MMNPIEAGARVDGRMATEAETVAMMEDAIERRLEEEDELDAREAEDIAEDRHLRSLEGE